MSFRKLASDTSLTPAGCSSADRTGTGRGGVRERWDWPSVPLHGMIRWCPSRHQAVAAAVNGRESR